MPKLIRATMISSVCLGGWVEVLTWHFSPLNSGIFCSRLKFPYSTIVLPFEGKLPLSNPALLYSYSLFSFQSLLSGGNKRLISNTSNNNIILILNTPFLSGTVLDTLHVLLCQSLSCIRLCDPMDCSPPDSSVHGTLQARLLEQVAISYSRGPS